MIPSPSIGLRRPVPLLAVEATVDQADHGARPLRVLGPVVPVRQGVTPRSVVGHLERDGLRRRP